MVEEGEGDGGGWEGEMGKVRGEGEDVALAYLGLPCLALALEGMGI